MKVRKVVNALFLLLLVLLVNFTKIKHLKRPRLDGKYVAPAGSVHGSQ